MPIPRRLFEQGLDPLGAKIIEILDSDPDNAYTQEDLAEKAGYDRSDIVGGLAWVLRLVHLRDEHLILSHVIQGVVYYASAKQPRA